jgi:hypothetical protein
MLFIFMLAIFFFALKMSTNEGKPKNVACKLHNWVYKDIGDGNEYLECSVCNKRPGDAIDDGEHPMNKKLICEEIEKNNNGLSSLNRIVDGIIDEMKRTGKKTILASRVYFMTYEGIHGKSYAFLDRFLNSFPEVNVLRSELEKLFTIKTQHTKYKKPLNTWFFCKQFEEVTYINYEITLCCGEE